MDITTAATALATVIAATAAVIATWGKSRQDLNSKMIRDLKSSNEQLLTDIALDRERSRKEIASLNERLDSSTVKYVELHEEYLAVKEENVSLKARVLHLESKLNG